MFEEVLKSKPHNAHYLNRYISFIKYYLNNNENMSNVEIHHICPKSKDMFPEYSSLKLYNWNKCILTPRQHFIAHWLLFRAYKTKGCAYSFRAMAYGQSNSNQGRIKSKQYELITKEVKSIMSECNKGMSLYKDKNGNIIRCKTDDPRVLSKELISIALGREGCSHTDEHKKKISTLMKALKYNPNKMVKLYFLDIRIQVLYHNNTFVELLEQGWSMNCTKEYKSKTSTINNINRSKESRILAGKKCSLTTTGRKIGPRPIDKLKPKNIYCYNELTGVFEFVNKHIMETYHKSVFTKGRIIFDEQGLKRHCNAFIPTPPGYYDEMPNTIYLYYDTINKDMKYIKIKDVQYFHERMHIPNGDRVRILLNNSKCIYLNKSFISQNGMPINCKYYNIC